MDLISLHQFGVKNVVASSGTALTEEQVQLLSRFSKNVTVLFDADIAGQKASLRSIEILLKHDFDVKLVSFPNGEDPDSYINNFGAEEFNSQINSAQNFLEYQAAQFEADGSFEDPVRQTEAVRELVKSASLVTDELKRQLFLKTISKKFNLREKLLEKELDKFIRLNRQQEKTTAERNQRIKVKETSESSELQNDTRLTNNIEKEIIQLLLEGKEEIIEEIFDHIHPEELKSKKFKQVMSIVEDCYKEGDISPSVIIEKVPDEETKNFILTLALDQDAISRKWDTYYDSGKVEPNTLQKTKDVVKKFRVTRIEESIRKNNNSIATQESDEEIINLMLENKELEAQKKLIIEGNGNSDLI